MRSPIRAIAFGVSLALPFALGQAPGSFDKGRLPAFEIVSIRPSTAARYPGADGGASITWSIQANGYRASNQTIESTIKVAYFPQGMASWTSDLLKGAPSWLDSEQYTIDARVSSEDLPAWQKQGSSLERKALFRMMLQSMLADRCRLVIHRVPQQVPGLSLVVGKRGARVTPTPSDEKMPTNGMRMSEGGVVLNEEDGHTLKFYGVTMEELSSYLSIFSYPRLIVQDNTGLGGRYDFVLKRPIALPGDDNIGSTRSWDLSTMGLEFREVKISMDAIVIDHVERPSAN